MLNFRHDLGALIHCRTGSLEARVTMGANVSLVICAGNILLSNHDIA